MAKVNLAIDVEASGGQERAERLRGGDAPGRYAETLTMEHPEALVGAAQASGQPQKSNPTDRRYYTQRVRRRSLTNTLRSQRVAKSIRLPGVVTARYRIPGVLGSARGAKRAGDVVRGGQDPG